MRKWRFMSMIRGLVARAERATPEPNGEKQTTMPRIYNAWEHSSWGDHIEIMNWEKGTIWGHLPIKPRKGDIIRFKMQSGNILQTSVKSVEYCSDPTDQFFAEIQPKEYLSEEAKPESELNPNPGLTFLA